MFGIDRLIDDLINDAFTDFQITQSAIRNSYPYRIYADKNNYYIDMICPLNEDAVKVKLQDNRLSINVKLPDLKDVTVIEDHLSNKFRLDFELNTNTIDVDKIKVKMDDMLRIILPKKETVKEKYIPIETEKKKKLTKE